MNAAEFARRVALNTDFSQIKSMVIDGGKKIQTVANDLLNDLQSRYQ